MYPLKIRWWNFGLTDTSKQCLLLFIDFAIFVWPLPVPVWSLIHFLSPLIMLVEVPVSTQQYATLKRFSWNFFDHLFCSGKFLVIGGFFVCFVRFWFCWFSFPFFLTFAMHCGIFSVSKYFSELLEVVN